MVKYSPNYGLSAHNHGHWDFGYDPESISHIESVWANLQSILKKLYISIPNHYFIFP